MQTATAGHPPRRRTVDQILLRHSVPGKRTAFLVESRSRRESRQIDELFALLGEATDVVQLAEGRIMAYAVRVEGQYQLLAKIELRLKGLFCFTIVERSFNERTYRLIADLCLDSASRLLPLERCGICDTEDAFPTKLELFDENHDPLAEGSYCAVCTARLHDADPRRFVSNLLARDRANFSGLPEVELGTDTAATPERDTTCQELGRGNDRIIAIAV